MSEVLLADTVTTEDSVTHVNGESLELLFVSRVLRDHHLVVDSLSEVQLAAENRRENSLSLSEFHCILAFSLSHLEVEDEATNLLLHAFSATTSKDGDGSVSLHNSRLQMETVNLMGGLQQGHCILHLAGVLGIMLGPDALLQVKHC